MQMMRPAILSCCLATLTAPASGQIYAVTVDFDFGDVYAVTPDPMGASLPVPIASYGAGFRSAGSAFDGTFHYAEDFDTGSVIRRADPTGATPTVAFTRTYATGGANNNLAADGSGVLWEIDLGTSSLYSLSFDEVGGTVSRTLEADLGTGPLNTMGDIAWGPDGLLYIATNSGQGNFIYDPADGTTLALGDTGQYEGLAWDGETLYGSVGGFGGILFEVRPNDMQPIGDILLFNDFALSDLAGFVEGGDDEPCDPTQPSVLTGDGSGVQTQTLFAGQTIDVGTVTAQVVEDDLVITYNTTGDWSLDELHLWAGVDLADMPSNRRGSPKIGNFPYAVENLGGLTTYSFSIPLDSLAVDCPADPERQYYIAAHAVVSSPSGGSETAWADGDRFVERGMWGTFFSTSFTCVCEDEPPVQQCETAFTASEDPFAPDTCFLDLDLDNDGMGDFDRWGWTISIPDSDGGYIFPIYVRAEGCNVTAAIQVGELFVTYEPDDDDADDFGLVIAEYRMFPGYTMDEVHFFAGETETPLDQDGLPTVALEFYSHIVDNFTGGPDENFATTYTYSLDWAGNGVNIIAHALVCGEFD